jgi:hypothetical protein
MERLPLENAVREIVLGPRWGVYRTERPEWVSCRPLSHAWRRSALFSAADVMWQVGCAHISVDDDVAYLR